jgi:hypothetical protein
MGVITESQVNILDACSEWTFLYSFIVSDILLLCVLKLHCQIIISFFFLQFFRSFPGPPDVNEADMTLLVQKYRDPDRPGLLNYLNLHHDIVAIGEQMAKDRELIEAPYTQVDGTRVMVCVILLTIPDYCAFKK